MKKKFRVYVATPIRGDVPEGMTKDELAIQMQRNCQTAKVGLDWLSENFPWVDFFCPAVNDRIVQRLQRSGFVNWDQILACDHEEQLLCRAVIAFQWEFSSGVTEEIQLAHNNNQMVYTIRHPDDLEEQEERLFSLFAFLRTYNDLPY